MLVLDRCAGSQQIPKLMYDDIFNMQAVCYDNGVEKRFQLFQKDDYKHLVWQPWEGQLVESEVPASLMSLVAKRPAAAPPQKEVEEEEEEEEEEQEEQEEEEEERKVKPPSKEEKKIKPLSKKEKKIKSPSKKRRVRICVKRPASKKDDGDDDQNVKHKVERVWLTQALTGNVRTYLLVKVGEGKKHLVAISLNESQKYKGLVQILMGEVKERIAANTTFMDMQTWAYQRKNELLASGYALKSA